MYNYVLLVNPFAKKEKEPCELAVSTQGGRDKKSMMYRMDVYVLIFVM